MKKKIKVSKPASVDMSAMIDVVFLLLIFFIVTSKEIIEEAHIAINFPKNESTSGSGTNNNIVIRILEETTQPKKSSAGFLVYEPNSKVYQFEKIKVNLQELSKLVKGIVEAGSEEAKVDIKSHEKSRTYRLVQVLDLCGKLGVKKLNVTGLE